MEKLYKLSTKDAMLEIIDAKSKSPNAEMDPNTKNSFFVCDLMRVYQKIQLWNQELGPEALGRGNKDNNTNNNNNKNHRDASGVGGVELYYAMKCNPDPVIIKLMNSLNLGYDCASQWEIEYMLGLGARPEKIIYANTIKEDLFIRYAAQVNVDLMTFDNHEELYKIKKHHPDAKLVLRLAVDDEGSLVRVSAKFGVPIDGVDDILKLALELDLDIVGVCFHVGSGCTDPMLYDKAIKDTRYAFDRAHRLGFKNVNLVNIGGGFEAHLFQQSAKTIREALDKYFLKGGYKDIRIMAEPGRFLVEDSCELATNVIGKRMQVPSNEDDIATMYYINSGVFDAFGNGQTHKNVDPKILSDKYQGEPQENCVVWGPCCTALDVANKKTRLPNIPIGEWLRWPLMGSYSSAISSSFNGFPKSKTFYTLSDQNVPFLKDVESVFEQH